MNKDFTLIGYGLVNKAGQVDDILWLDDFSEGGAYELAVRYCTEQVIPTWPRNIGILPIYQGELQLIDRK